MHHGINGSPTPEALARIPHNVPVVRTYGICPRSSRAPRTLESRVHFLNLSRHLRIPQRLLHSPLSAACYTYETETRLGSDGTSANLDFIQTRLLPLLFRCDQSAHAKGIHQTLGSRVSRPKDSAYGIDARFLKGRWIRSPRGSASRDLLGSPQTRPVSPGSIHSLWGNSNGRLSIWGPN